MANEEITITFVGDVTLSAGVAENIENLSPQYPFEFVKKELKNSDINVGNLEGPLTESNNICEKSLVTLKCGEKGIEGLKEAGFTILTLANNHIMNYGDRGLCDTLRLLKENKILFMGAGKNGYEARKPVIIEKKGIKFAFLAYAGNRGAINRPGVAGGNIKKVLSDIKKIKENVNFIVVSIHWGLEFEDVPLPSEIIYAHTLIDNGVDLVIGHHPHVIRGIEEYKNKLIAYSLGNFVTDYKISFHDANIRRLKERNWQISLAEKRTRESIILKITLKTDGTQIRIKNYKTLPIWINDYFQPILVLNTKIGNDIIKRLETISKKILEINFDNISETENKYAIYKIQELANNGLLHFIIFLFTRYINLPHREKVVLFRNGIMNFKRVFKCFL